MFTLPKLDYNQLGLFIDGGALEIHYGRDHQTYVDNLKRKLYA